MDYQTFPPTSELEAFIKCYWTLEHPAEIQAQRQRIIPDGCMEMIFHYGDLYRQFIPDGGSIVQPRCFVFGQINTPLEIAPTGATGIFSVRFFPDGFTPFSTLPMKNIANRAVPLAELYGDEQLGLEQEVLAASSTADRIILVEEFLTRMLVKQESIDKLVQSTVETILSIDGNISVGELSEQLNINPRQLERKFSVAVGLSPKQLSKIIRLQRTLDLLVSKQFTSLTALAYEGQYYDQAHFIKDFKEFTGVSPKNFYADNLKMTSLFYSKE